MQQGSQALKRDGLNRLRLKAAALIGLGALCLSGCAAAWSGAWSGTADLGPVEARTLTLHLLDGEPATAGASALGSVRWAAAGGAAHTFQVCKRQVVGPKITLEIDTAHPDCSAGADAKPLRLEGTIGAGVIHGDLFRGQERVGFFRAFRENAAKSAFQPPPHKSSPTPEQPTEGGGA